MTESLFTNSLFFLYKFVKYGFVPVSYGNLNLLQGAGKIRSGHFSGMKIRKTGTMNP